MARQVVISTEWQEYIPHAWGERARYEEDPDYEPIRLMVRPIPDAVFAEFQRLTRRLVDRDKLRSVPPETAQALQAANTPAEQAAALQSDGVVFEQTEEVFNDPRVVRLILQNCAYVKSGYSVAVVREDVDPMLAVYPDDYYNPDMSTPEGFARFAERELREEVYVKIWLLPSALSAEQLGNSGRLPGGSTARGSRKQSTPRKRTSGAGSTAAKATKGSAKSARAPRKNASATGRRGAAKNTGTS